MNNDRPVEDILALLGYLTLGSRFRRLGERLQAETMLIVAPQSGTLPAGQLPFLAAIDRFGPMSVGDMAATIGITQPGATKNLAQLEKLGMVVMAHSREDRRRRVASLTDAGREVVAHSQIGVWQSVEAAARRLCDGLEGTMLDQLAELERRLAEKPLREWGHDART